MASTKIASNKNVRFDLGAATAVSSWDYLTLADVNAMLNASEATKWDGFDVGHQASEQDEDRALTDSAGASTRGYENYGGTANFFMPVPTDTSSVERRTRNLVSTLHTELAAVVRPGVRASAPWAAGQVYNAYHTITDANRHARGDKNRYYTIAFKPRGAMIVNGIIPSSTPKPVAISGDDTVDLGGVGQLRATYEGRDITVGAHYVSSDPTVAEVTKHGVIIPLSAGTTNITATYPGSAAGSTFEVTVGSGGGGG